MENPVMVVQDGVDSGAGYGALIQRALGYDVITATNGVHALSLLRAGVRPCLIVLDLRVPGAPGVASCAEQLADPSLVRCPVIVCAERLDSGLCLERLTTRVYLRKPIDPRTLLRVVENVCADPVLN